MNRKNSESIELIPVLFRYFRLRVRLNLAIVLYFFFKIIFKFYMCERVCVYVQRMISPDQLFPKDVQLGTTNIN